MPAALGLVLVSAAFAKSRATTIGSADSDAAATSSGWINFTPFAANLGIYFPVSVDGHKTLAMLYGYPSTIDKKFAESIGLHADANGSIHGLDIKIGELTLHNASADPDDLYPDYYANIVGQPVACRFGEELFKHFIVDIDYPNHRVAFHAAPIGKPAGALEIPMPEVQGKRVVPLSINGAPPGQFELDYGNVIGPLLVTPQYARNNKLLDGRQTSLRFVGPNFKETIVTVDRLTFEGVDFPKVPIAIIPDSEVPPAPIIGSVGLPLLSHFRNIIDYGHNRIFAVPGPDAASNPIPKDRIGFLLVGQNHKFVVAFVSPNSPASAAGFKPGEKIDLIDGKALDAWAGEAVVRFQMTDPGTTHTFTMPDGTIRRVTAADFF